jgi:glucan endo-1,3-beta-D-glucosidase
METNQIIRLGHNSFPYFETTRANSIDQARENFYAGLGQTESVSGGKEVWVTETGKNTFQKFSLYIYLMCN